MHSNGTVDNETLSLARERYDEAVNLMPEGWDADSIDYLRRSVGSMNGILPGISKIRRAYLTIEGALGLLE